jgi:alanyl-tRNA synthetase
VTDTTKIQANVFGHHGTLSTGTLKIGDTLTAHVDQARRQRITLNHSATHLLHAALRHVLGTHVQQKGSLVDAERTRFDFAHSSAITAEQLHTIETLLNTQIRTNHAISCQLMTYDAAIEAGAMALFGEKYGDEVRVVGMGEFSTELCGGTHAQRTGDIGYFKIISESGVAAGVRRIEAVTGASAVAHSQHQQQQLQGLAQQLKANTPADIAIKLTQLQDEAKTLDKELQRLKSKLAAAQSGDLAQQAQTVGNIKVLATALPDADSKTLRDTLDRLKTQLGTSVIVLASVNDGKVSLIAGVSADLTQQIKAGELVNHVAQQVGGKGGGRADMAQAGGTDPSGLTVGLASVVAWVQTKQAAIRLNV